MSPFASRSARPRVLLADVFGARFAEAAQAAAKTKQG